MNILIYIIFVFSGSSLAAAQNQLTVVKVYDGDTFTGAFSHGTLKIRLLCVDAPELSYSPWGPNAQNRLLQWIPLGSKVTVKNMSLDIYGRTLAFVFTANDTNLSEQMCKEGWNRAYLAQQGCSAYSQLDKYAQARKLNTWADPSYITPGDYKRNLASTTTLKPGK